MILESTAVISFPPHQSNNLTRICQYTYFICCACARVASPGAKPHSSPHPQLTHSPTRTPHKARATQSHGPNIRTIQNKNAPIYNQSSARLVQSAGICTNTRGKKKQIGRRPQSAFLIARHRICRTCPLPRTLVYKPSARLTAI